MKIRNAQWGAEKSNIQQQEGMNQQMGQEQKQQSAYSERAMATAEITTVLGTENQQQDVQL